MPGFLTTKGFPSPKLHQILGAFSVKPFLAQGAVIASEKLGDYQWVSPVYENLRLMVAYREKTQYDPKWKLFFWETAMQSGEDNNVALTNDPKDHNAIMAVDLCTFQLREYRAMARLGEMLGKKTEAAEYRQKADQLRAAMLKHLWFAQEKMFFNVRRDTGKPVRHISGSSFIPLIEDILPRDDARAMIRQYLWNPDHMLAPYGIRSLSKQDPGYNNVSMIEPYSNWQGPVWINTNYLYFLALKRYGFDDEARQLAGILGRLVLADIRKWGSMHECYHAETGDGLPPASAHLHSAGKKVLYHVCSNCVIEILAFLAHGHQSKNASRVVYNRPTRIPRIDRGLKLQNLGRMVRTVLITPSVAVPNLADYAGAV